MGNPTPETQAWLDETRDMDAYLDRLRRAMAEQKISKAHLARAAGCSPSNISSLMRQPRLVHWPNVPKYIWRAATRILARQERLDAAREAKREVTA